jgi:hypothetical protein
LLPTQVAARAALAKQDYSDIEPKDKDCASWRLWNSAPASFALVLQLDWSLLTTEDWEEHVDSTLGTLGDRSVYPAPAPSIDYEQQQQRQQRQQQQQQQQKEYIQDLPFERQQEQGQAAAEEPQPPATPSLYQGGGSDDWGSDMDSPPADGNQQQAAVNEWWQYGLDTHGRSSRTQHQQQDDIWGYDLDARAYCRCSPWHARSRLSHSSSSSCDDDSSSCCWVEC